MKRPQYANYEHRKRSLFPKDWISDQRAYIEQLEAENKSLKENQKGWVIIGDGGIHIHSFTFSTTRADAQRKYARLWKINNWKHHYRKGCRCVKADMTIRVNIAI